MSYKSGKYVKNRIVPLPFLFKCQMVLLHSDLGPYILNNNCTTSHIKIVQKSVCCINYSIRCKISCADESIDNLPKLSNG